LFCENMRAHIICIYIFCHRESNAISGWLRSLKFADCWKADLVPENPAQGAAESGMLSFFVRDSRNWQEGGWNWQSGRRKRTEI
jgi:hypothetical protein